jgi:hypothetical protein
MASVEEEGEVRRLNGALMDRWNVIVALQKKHCAKLIKENAEGNMYSASVHFEVIRDIQKALDDM